MFAYDRNGLQLSPVKHSMNAYRLTSVDVTNKKFDAYINVVWDDPSRYKMHEIGSYKDPRDAAYVAQEFEKIHFSDERSKSYVKDLINEGKFAAFAREFRQSIEIPEWQYPAEGLDMEDITNDYGYKQNRVEDARQALIECIKVFNLTPPPLNQAKNLIAKVEGLYKKGKGYREAAKLVMEDVMEGV